MQTQKETKKVTKGYTEHEVVNFLSKDKRLNINLASKLIEVKEKESIGIRTKGKLDYLKNYNQWTVVRK